MTKNNQTLVNEQQIPEGYKKTEVGLIPDDWELIKLAEIAEVKMCKRVLSAQTKKNDVIPFFKIGTFGGEPDTYISKSLYDEFRAKYSFPEKGDILISAAGTLGKTVIYDGKESYFQDSNIVWLKVDKKKISNEYLYHYYKVIQWAATEGTTIARLYNGIIYDTQILLPPINEQKIVAEALSDTDALISELEKLIEKKQAIKTATMQQLLTGKTRLPEFALREDGTPKAYKESELGQIPEDWEVCKFEKLCKVFTKQTGFDYSAYIKPSLIKQYKRGHIPFVQNKDFEGKNFNFDTDYYIPKDIAEKFPNILLNEKCLLISISGSIGNVGLFNESSLAFIGGAIAIAKFIDPNKLDWVMYYMLSQQGQNTLLNNVKAGSHQNITLEDIRKFSIPLPSDMEQNLITSMLSSLDAEIKNLDFRLDKLKRIKLGMMQELLTGKTRLV